MEVGGLCPVVPVFDGALGLAVDVALLQHLLLVVALTSAGEGHSHLYEVSFGVYLYRHDGHAFLLLLGFEPDYVASFQ